MPLPHILKTGIAWNTINAKQNSNRLACVLLHVVPRELETTDGHLSRESESCYNATTKGACPQTSLASLYMLTYALGYKYRASQTNSICMLPPGLLHPSLQDGTYYHIVDLHEYNFCDELHNNVVSLVHLLFPHERVHSFLLRR